MRKMFTSSITYVSSRIFGSPTAIVFQPTRILRNIPIHVRIKMNPLILEEIMAEAADLVDKGELPNPTSHPTYFADPESHLPTWAILVAINRQTEHACVVALPMNSAMEANLEKHHITGTTVLSAFPQITFSNADAWPDMEQKTGERTDSYMYHIHKTKDLEYRMARYYLEDPFGELGQTIPAEGETAPSRMVYDCWFVGISRLSLKGLNLIALMVLEEFRQQSYEMTRQDCLEFAKSFARKISTLNGLAPETIESSLRWLTVTDPARLLGVVSAGELSSRHTSSGHSVASSHRSSHNTVTQLHGNG